MKRVVRLAKQGHLSRAVKVLESDGLVAITPEVLESIKRLHPPSAKPAPKLPSDAAAPIIEKSWVRITVRRLINGAAPGWSGWTPEILHPLLKDADTLEEFTEFLQLIIRGEVPEAIRQLVLGGRGIAGRKKDAVAPTDVRPICMPDLFLKVIMTLLLKPLRSSLQNITAPIQLGAGTPGGAEIMVKRMQLAVLSAKEDSVLLKIDFRNAFNEVHRRQMLEQLFKYEQLRSLWTMVHWSYRSPTTILFNTTNGWQRVSSQEGLRQGDPFGPAGFALAVQPVYEAAAARMSLPDKAVLAAHRPSEDSTVAALADDVAVAGPWQSALTFYDYIQQAAAKIGLVIRSSKCKLLWISQDGIPGNVAQEAETRGLLWTTTVKVAGIVVIQKEDNPEVELWVDNQVSKVSDLLRKLQDPLIPAQIALLLLRQCVLPKLTFLMRVLPPQLILGPATKFDGEVLRLICKRLGLQEENLSEDTRTMIRLPIRMGGLGYRKMADLPTIAFWASSAAAASDLQPFERRLPADNVFFSSLRYCIEDVERLNDAEAPAVEHFLSFFQANPPKRLQQNLTVALEEQQFRLLKRKQEDAKGDAPAIWNARNSSATQPGAGAWLTAVPKTIGLTMSDNEYQVAARIRLGLPAVARTKGQCFHSQCARVRLLEHPDHFLCCQGLRNGVGRQRHNRVGQAIVSWARQELGASYWLEPSVPPGHRSERGTRRSDILFHLGGKAWLVDVSVTHPLAPSLVKAASREVLSAARKREQVKIGDDDKGARMIGARCRPFVVETLGAIGEQARKFANEIMDTALEVQGIGEEDIASTKAEWSQALYQQVAVALQKGNALQILEGNRATLLHSTTGVMHVNNEIVDDVD